MTRSSRSRLEPLLSLLCSYLLALAALSVITLTQPFSDAHGWWTIPGLLLTVLPVLFLAALPIGVFGFVVKRKRLMFGSVLVTTLALWLFAPLFGSRPLPNTSADISVMTFNTIVNPTALEDAVNAYGTDLVLIQETPGLSELQELEITEHYSLIYGGERRGNAVLSKYPVLAERNISLGGGWEAQRLVIEVGDGRELAVYNIHLSLPLNLRPVESTLGQLFGARYDERVRNAQIRTLLEELETEPLPYIVAGDFNLSEYSPIYHELAAVMSDSYREASRGFGFSWHSALPFLRIDYIWHSSALVAVKSLRGERFDSDHYPVISGLAWVREE